MTTKTADGLPFNRRWARSTCVAAVCLALSAGAPAFSQSFDQQDSSENIADSEISVGDERAAEHIEDLLSSMENLRTSIDRVKIITNMERIGVVYLSDMIESAPPELEQAVEENSELIRELQRGVEASAIFYNALMSQDVNIPDVVSIELDEPDATIFVRGVAPDQGIPLEDTPEEPVADDPVADDPLADEPPAGGAAATDVPATQPPLDDETTVE